uniref:non-specific serine/threonine protein kinase n=1 Tax=Leersia perrieri TaxID=77586 RepID=A0A0D9WIN9_9ORYZ
MKFLTFLISHASIFHHCVSGNFLPVTSDHNKNPQIHIHTYTPPPQSASNISDPPPQRSPSPAPVSGGTVSYADLEEATDGFSDRHLLGHGGFGHVYRGVLRGSRQEVAIKKLRPGSGQGDREFRAEVDIISRVHHRNLVSLVGFCIHAHHRLLVYEFVPNKTLHFHLHESGRAALDWARRWKIAVGSAKGLAYLHEDCRPKIIHRDIKAANILLDYSFEPKVADFGLAKIQPGDKTHVSTRVIGTFGYVAPEYAHTGKVNDRSDVYSFGVVLLELITGRRPLMSTEPYNDETLVSWARPLLTKALEEHVYDDDLVDPKLNNLYDAHDMHRLITIAAAAVRQTARSRPRMSQIVRYMEGELSIEDLNAGVAPGQSSLHSPEQSGDTTEQIRLMRRLAFVPGTGTVTGASAVSDSSYLSELTSEYGLNPSSSSSDGDDTASTSRPHAAAAAAASSPDDTAEAASLQHSAAAVAAANPMSRRTRHGRAGRLP